MNKRITRNRNLLEYDDGRVFVEGKNEYGKKYKIEYEPPGYELIDDQTGKAVKTKGEFIAKKKCLLT